MKRRIIALILAFCMAAVLASCGGNNDQSTTAPSESSAESKEQTTEAPVTEAPTTKEPTTEEPSSEPAAEQKPVILAVSFGTSYNDNRELSIGGVEKALQDAFPDYEVRRAFTAQTIIDILKERDGIETDNVTEAMARLVADGVKEVVIQPTHVMPGYEYDDVIQEISAFKDKFESFKVGKPLLTKDSDYAELIKAITEETKEYNQEGTAVVFMGHGTEHESNKVYANLQEKISSAGYYNYFIGTVEAKPDLNDVIEKVTESGAKKVVLQPLMIVAGDHANNDMAGDEEDSWKSGFEAAGFEVECVLKGLGQYEGVQNLIVKHCQETINGEDEQKPVVLAVSFGTSYNNNRCYSIGAVETAIQEAYPDYEVRRAFTAQTIIDILKERDGIYIDNVTEAMARLISDGVKEVVIQPTHVMPGFEYDDVVKEVEAFKDQFESFKISKPLLTEDEDFDQLIKVITEETKEYDEEGTAIIFMGHGTEHKSNEVYQKLQDKIAEAGYKNYFIGTVEATPGLEDVIAKAKEINAKKVILLPLMIVAGDHANNDMAGDEEDSWKTAFENEGFEVECVLKGLGQYEGVRKMIVKHLGETMGVEGQKPVMLVVSFGTSYNDSREKTIGAVEAALQEAYPNYEVRRAFTAQTIIDILKERDGIETENVTEAMARLVVEGVKEVVVQPTHVMAGFEYDDLCADAELFAKQFDKYIVGKPLLTKESDFDEVVEALVEETKDYNQEGTAIVYMGHGTEHDSNSVYTSLQSKFAEKGYDNYFVGTVEAQPDLEDVIGKAKEYGAKKVVLLPLMIVAGDHANNDMAGDEDDSWKSGFEAAGFEVECVLKGLGEYEGIRDLIVKHAGDAVNPPEPLKASQIENGTYEIEVDSSSSMFRVVKCELIVEDEKMEAVMTMSGQGYDKLFMGTGEEADKASEDDFIQMVKDADDKVTFKVPVESLNTEIDCAAWSIKKERWYDRKLVFKADSIPAEALKK